MVRVTRFDSVSALPDPVIGEIRYTAQQNIFRCFEWFDCLEHLVRSSGHAPCIYLAEREPGDFALLCLMQVGEWHLASLSDVYSLEFAPVFGPATTDPASLLTGILEFVRAEKPRWHGMRLNLMYAENGEAEVMAGALERTGFFVEKFFQYENHFKDIRGLDFETYFASVPSRARNTIRRKHKKLQELDFEMAIYDAWDDDHFAAYMKIYDKSWKQSEKSDEFIRRMYRTMAELGLLRMGIAYLDGEPIAAQAWIISGPRVVIYKLAYDEAFREYSAGSILTKTMMEAVFPQAGIEEIDYGVGSEPYKADWMDARRTLWGIDAFSTASLRGNLAIARSRLGRVMRHLRRRISSGR
jgi:hypothetical protein